jgi:hypothetical protein
MSRGIVGPFETWKAGIDHPCMSGDIASTAGLTVHEPDDRVVHFAKWRPFDQDAVSRSAVSAPAREDDGAAREVAADAIATPLRTPRTSAQPTQKTAAASVFQSTTVRSRIVVFMPLKRDRQ